MNTCGWCKIPVPDRSKYCSVQHRQAAFRLRRRTERLTAASAPGRFAYADPPYPGRAKKHYGCAETDYPALVARLEKGAYLGWALSSSADSLRWLLPLCPPTARVCPWVKPIGVPPRTFGMHNAWEPLIVVGGRQTPPGVRDWLSAKPARFGGSLPGRKPLSFAAWLFGCLGMQPGDTLDDLYPGTGVISRAWASLSSEYSRDASPGAAHDSLELSA